LGAGQADRRSVDVIARLSPNSGERDEGRRCDDIKTRIVRDHAIGRRAWKCLRIATQAAAAARCLSVCPLTKCPSE
jgi:hypothetical protein